MNAEANPFEIIADVIREHYDLGEVSPPRLLEMTHQRRHRKLVVDTSAGRFLVKTYKNDPVVLDALRFQHRLSEHLEKNELPVARIRVAKSGKRIVELPAWALELQEFLEGEQMAVQTDTLTIASKVLGRFHKVCEDVPVPPRDARMWRFSEVPRTSFQRFFDRAREEGGEDRITGYCNEIALFLRSAATELDIEHRKEFETGLIHGDWHGGNLLFQTGRLVAILDLEFAGAGCYLEDLAYAISNLCVRTTLSEEKLAYRTNLVLDNYQLSRSLSYAELVALYFAVGVKHVTTVSYQVPLQDGVVAGYTSAEWMERLAFQCRWLSERSRKARWGEA
ncbi:MAG: phosphotransferase [Candidatus Hydrogenedentes bacterium]|nr:phosphotransferase [Candidatus Hydrogenedentota bacterium]